MKNRLILTLSLIISVSLILPSFAASEEIEYKEADEEITLDSQAEDEEMASDADTAIDTESDPDMISIVVIGDGEVIEKEGILIYEADKGYEITSIVSDMDTAVCDAGEEVIADELCTGMFSPGATVTFMFEAEETGDDDMDAAPKSWGAIFG